jgi:hypothetical protein
MEYDASTVLTKQKNEGTIVEVGAKREETMAESLIQPAEPRLGGISLAGILVMAGSLFCDQPLHAQSPGASGSIAQRMNVNPFTIVTGSPARACMTFGYDLAAVPKNSDELRILSIISQGASRNVRDGFLRRVDLGFAQTNILSHFRRIDEIGDLTDKLVYILKIRNDYRRIERSQSIVPGIHEKVARAPSS